MNTFTPIETLNLGDRVNQVIRKAIISGELPPGAPVRDRQLAEELGVSRTPVRDALRRLQTEGLVEPQGRSGWSVTPFTEQDVRELFQLRILLEPVGLEELEKHRDPERIAEISGYFAPFEHPIELERHLEYFQRDDEFHSTIVECSNNSRIIGFYKILNSHINRGRFVLSGSSAERVEDTLDEHRVIVDAVIEGDYARARKALVEHLRTGEELMIRRLRVLAQG